MSDPKKLDKEDLERVKHTVSNNPAYFWLRIQERSQFEVGDVLIKMINQNYWDEDEKRTYKPEMVSEKSRCNRKYQCVYVDELGVPWLKVIKINGELGDNLICAADQDPSFSFWAADPDYAEHLILAADGQEFNPAATFEITKKHRNEVAKHNKSIRLKGKSLRDADTVIRGIKAGDKLWIAYRGDDHNAHENEFVVTSKYLKTVEKIIDETYGNAKDSFETFNKKDVFQVLRIKNTKDNSDTGEVYAGSLFFGERFVYNRKPRSYELGS